MAFKHILVPVDFSEYSDAAMKVAVNLAKKLDSQILALHVCPDLQSKAQDYWVGYLISIQAEIKAQENIEKKIRKKLEEYVGHFQEKYPHITLELRRGQTGEEILEIAKGKKFDLIVMGTHGRSSLLHLAMGSTTEQIIRNAPCPVLTVRA